MAINWISVKDKLPEFEIPCLAYMTHYDEYIIAEYGADGEWLDRADLMTNVTRLVTHWAELHPPKEAKTE